MNCLVICVFLLTSKNLILSRAEPVLPRDGHVLNRSTRELADLNDPRQEDYSLKDIQGSDFRTEGGLIHPIPEGMPQKYFDRDGKIQDFGYDGFGYERDPFPNIPVDRSGLLNLLEGSRNHVDRYNAMKKNKDKKAFAFLPRLMRSYSGNQGRGSPNNNPNGMVLSIDLGIKALRDALIHAKTAQQNRNLQMQAQRNMKLLHNIGKRKSR